MDKFKQKLQLFKHDGLAILRVSFWVLRVLAGVLAMNSDIYKCQLKHINFTLSAVVGFLVVAQVIWEIHTVVRDSLLPAKK